MIQRFFHPVGQGAFYSERHMYHNINIVYDCGTEYKNRYKTSIKKIVSQSFRSDEIIHILFISHFDCDHISLIKELKKTVKRIERVVIPLLHEEEKIYLANIYKSLGEPSLALLVNNPNKFFGQETHVITVRQDDNENISTIDVSEGGDITEVSNGTPLTLNGLNDWVYIPFNYEYKSRNKEFLSKLEEKNIDIDKLKNDPEYIQDETVKDTIKKIYKGISGNINQNSMFLYSGPKENPHSHYSKRRCYYYKIYCWWSGCYTCHCEPYKVACLYTGDGDLNGVKVKAI